MNQALEKMKMLVGMDVEEQQAPALEENSSFSFMDDLNRNCTLSTKQVLYSSLSLLFGLCLVARKTKEKD